SAPGIWVAMSSLKGKFLRFGSALLRRAKGGARAQAGSRFSRLPLHTAAPRASARRTPQLLFATGSVGAPRPTRPPPDRGRGVVLLGWTQAGGPGARWIAEVTVGSEVHFAGPQRSLALPKGPVVIVGDETSVGVAASYAAERAEDVHAILQGSSPDALRSAAE